MSIYAEKLQHPKWQRRRLEILNRDNFACTICGDTESALHVHHYEYLGNIDPWEYSDDMLTTLCNMHHDKELGRESLEKHLAMTLKMNGFLYDDLVALSCLMETDKNFCNYILKFIRKFKNG